MAKLSSHRYLVPGDVFARLCVTLLHQSDDLLAIARTVASLSAELSPDLAGQLETGLLRAWHHQEAMRILLQIISDEGQLGGQA